jgi:CheY-like chemotaxis protein
VDVNVPTRGVFSVLGQQLKINNINVVLELEDDLPFIMADENRLEQVFINLVINARDAMLKRRENDPEAGPLVLTIRSFLHNDMVTVTFSDTGTGIPAAVQGRVFEPFYTTKEVGKGTGLGLTTVFALAKNHGGFVTVDSELGQGSSFRVFLPALQSGYVPRTPHRPERTARGTGQLILLVDDELPVCEITRLALEKNGYRVVTAHDGAEALAEYFSQKTPVDLVLTDLNMPIMDGPALIRALKKLDPAIRIVAATGVADKAKLAEIAEADLKAFLAKPFTAEKLLRVLAEALL